MPAPAGLGADTQYAVQPQPVKAVTPPAPKPTLPAAPTGPPNPTLLAEGFHGSPADFMHRLDAVTAAHMKVYGTRPTPGVALDVARSTVPVEHFEPMFTATPMTETHARAKADLAANKDYVEPIKYLAAGLTAAVKDGTLPQFINEHHSAVQDAFADPTTRTQMTTAMYQSGVNDPAQVLQEAIFPMKPNVLGKIVMAPASPVEQISLGIGLGIPMLVYKEGKGIVSSVQQSSPDPFLKTNEDLAKASYHGVGRDIHHPEQNIGNLILDIWGASSLIGGAAARAGAVGKAVSEGAGAAAIARAAASRASTGTYELGPGAEVPLSSNPLAAKVQGIILDKRANGMTATGDTEAVPMGAAAVTISERSNAIANGLTDPFGLRTDYLSIPNKIQRQLRAATRIERDMRLAVMEPALRVTRSAINTDGTIARIGPKRWLGLSAPEQKMIQVLSTDDPHPFDTWQTFHENAIKNGWGNPADHQAQLSLLPAARRAAENPSPKVTAALEAVKSVMAEQTVLRIRALGLTPEAAEGRVASLGEVVRGDMRNPARNAQTPALTGSDDILRLAALGKTPEQIAHEIVKPVPEGRGAGQPRYANEEVALEAVRAKLATPEAQQALTPQRVRSVQKNPEAFYLPFVSAAHTRGHGSFWGVRANKYGIPIPSSLPELSHEFTGDSIRAGDFRVDATNLARESYARTVHVVSRANAWKRLWEDYSVDTPTSEHHQPIRDERAVNDHLKGLFSKIEQGYLTEKDIEGVPQETLQNLNRFLFPGRDEIGPNDHVRWVDERLMDDARTTKPGKVAKTFSAVNEPLRDAMLFLRPAYIFNLVNNIQLAAMHEGILTIPNLVRAAKANEWYGAREARMLDALAGEGRMLSYSPSDAGKATTISRALGSAWNVVTDKFFRRASVIHELRKQGFRTTEEIKGALNDALNDPEVMKQVVEASQRAKQAMVEMDNLTWFEKAHLRHLIFTYPWVSRSFVWSLRFLRDHPAQAALYNEIGQSAEIENDPILRHLPNWMKDNSVMPVGFDKEGNPIVVNPGSVDTWATMGQALGLARGDQTLSDLFGPGADLILHFVTQRDRFGRQYKNPITGPALDTLTGLPQVAAYTRAGQQSATIPPNNLGDPRGLEKQEAAAAKGSIYVPGSFMNTYGPLMFGGLTPRVLDKTAVEAKFWKNAPYPERNQHITALMLRQAHLQGELIGTKSVPVEVRDGIKLVGDRALAYHDYAAKQGHTPTLRERAQIDIDVLASKHLISDGQQAELTTRLAAAPDDEVNNFRSGVINTLAYGKEMSDWYFRARTVARVANSLTLDEDVQKLITNKLLPADYKDAANANESTLTKYGRGYLAYTDGIKKLTKQANTLRKQNKDITEVAAELRAYVDQHAAAVKIDGRTLPPYSSLAMAHLSSKEVEALKVGLYTQPWLSMSATDKDLTGYKTDPKVTTALVAYAHYTSPSYLATQYPVGERSLDGAQKLAIIKQLDTAYKLKGALVNDYQTAQEPRYLRYQQLDIYKQSPNRKNWKDLFERAGELWSAAHPSANDVPSITVSQMHDAWAAWTAQVLPVIEKTQPAFYAELKPYLTHDPKFLEEMVSR